MSAQSLLSVRDLRIGMGARVLAEGINLDLRTGELWCVLGPNGSGKSTLLHTLAGMRDPLSGRVVFAGRAWPRWRPRDAARRRGLLLQHPSYAFSIAVSESVMLGRHPHIGRFGAAGEDDRRCVRSALQAMDLARLADRDVITLSGGERQRVALATVLAQDPDLLLLDEPTAHLDLAHQVALFRRLSGLTGEGRAVMLATHDYNLAARFATHVCLLFGDARVLTGAAAEILRPEILSDAFEFPLGQHGAAAERLFVPQW